MRNLIRTISTWVSSLSRTNRLPINTNEAHASSIVLAMSLGYRLPMPSSPVDRPEEWYLINCIAGVESKLASINEETVIYLTDAMNLTKQVWLKRYRLLHTPFSNESTQLLRQVSVINDRNIPDNYKDILTKVSDDELKDIIYSISQVIDNQKLETTNV